MKPSIRHNDTLIVLPRVRDGIDWNVERPLMARKVSDGKPLLDLFWVPGHMHYAGKARGKVYIPSQLVLQVVNQGSLGAWGNMSRTLRTGGKVTDKMPAEVALEINKLFGADVAGWIKHKFTVIVEDML